MSNKLGPSDYRIILVVVLISAASLGVSIKYFARVFPEASLELRVSRSDSQPLAHQFLTERGAQLDGYRHAAVFDFDDQAKVYLERSQGLPRMNQLTRGPIRLWRWSHRWFRPQQKEEWHAQVTPSGEVVGFKHEIPEAAPGATLTAVAARELAEKFLSEVMHRDLADLEFVESETNQRPMRADHTFTWIQKSVPLGEGSLRVAVGVAGDQVSSYHEFVKVPEQWSRDYEKLRSRNESAQRVAEVCFVLLTVAMLVVLIRRLRDRDVPLRLALGFGVVAAALYFLGQLNTFSLSEFGYPTTDSYASFVMSFVRNSLFGALGLGTFIAILVASGEPVYRESYPNLVALRKYLTWSGLRTRSFFLANVVGIGLTFFFFAYQTVFYLAAEKLGAWAPADVPISDLLNTRIPWVTVLFIGFYPAVSEEMQFRAFAIPFLRKLLRSQWIALVLAAFIWGFLHAAYPNQPFFIRGLEVGLGGIVIGLVMLRFGILAALIWHYSVDALYTAMLLLRAPNSYFVISGAVTAGIMLIPLAVALIAYWRKGAFYDEGPLTNAAVGTARRAPSIQPETQPDLPTYQPLSKNRLAWAAALSVVFLAVTLIPTHRFAKNVKVALSRAEALARADAYLRAQQAQPENFRKAARLDENIDYETLQYLLERRRLAEADRVYQSVTKVLLWEVRYYRPLKKEEHLVYIDVGTGRVFNHRHLLAESTPGANLPPEEARKLAEDFLVQQGYRLPDFDLQDLQSQKREARQDYTLVYQAKAGDPRNVDDAHFRLGVNVAGDRVVGVSRYIKLPEEWRRQRSATHLLNSILAAISGLWSVGLMAGVIILFVVRVRRGRLPWRASAVVAGVVFLLTLGAELNQLTQFGQQYNTAVSLASERLRVGVTIVVSRLVIALLTWLMVALVWDLYPAAKALFLRAARRLWRRDALVAVGVSLAVSVGIRHLSAVFTDRFHGLTSFRPDLVTEGANAVVPALSFWLGSLSAVIVGTGLTAVAIFIIHHGWVGRKWWFWAGGALFLISLGPTQARSAAEFAVQWAWNVFLLLVVGGLVVLLFRGNVLAYVAVGFTLFILEPATWLLSQPAIYYRAQGLLLLALALPVWWWLFALGSERSSAAG